mmetsp:Transcript_16152/g.43824  ORF Transcript_16152/g.43824 Transcript_16152/m.43824 type:complete len:273 (+) Transcript_16152:1341-2159(+)
MPSAPSLLLLRSSKVSVELPFNILSSLLKCVAPLSPISLLLSTSDLMPVSAPRMLLKGSISSSPSPLRLMSSLVRCDVWCFRMLTTSAGPISCAASTFDKSMVGMADVCLRLSWTSSVYPFTSSSSRSSEMATATAAQPARPVLFSLRSSSVSCESLPSVPLKQVTPSSPSLLFLRSSRVNIELSRSNMKEITGTPIWCSNTLSRRTSSCSLTGATFNSLILVSAFSLSRLSAIKLQPFTLMVLPLRSSSHRCESLPSAPLKQVTPSSPSLL